ncbi:hypothetical protein EVAR_41961_1 [Eumeta japonica]|uniref:Uncharacterized protein n=1 Tax=Eumeta variegata TaxID=151549 RepID=A0A4C1WRG4_EUMVA|nr:hypothetical protein EVAR_41961_1 [Eumeta japonica]
MAKVEKEKALNTGRRVPHDKLGRRAAGGGRRAAGGASGWPTPILYRILDGKKNVSQKLLERNKISDGKGNEAPGLAIAERNATAEAVSSRQFSMIVWNLTDQAVRFDVTTELTTA